MHSTDELVKDLVELPRRKYVEVLKKVDEQRRIAAELPEPFPGMDQEAFARWIGYLHCMIDAGVARVYYLPGNAPEGEVRLVEVNELAKLPETAPIVAVDFMPVLDGIDYSVFVADVTPSQWEAVSRREQDLPQGWTLDGHLLVAQIDQ